MTQPSSKPGLPSPRPLAIPAHWTPEQAQVVVELLDDLREHIMAYYQLKLFDWYREQLGAGVIEQPDAADNDLSF